MKARVHYKTLIKVSGVPQRADRITDTQWQLAVKEGRFATVYHSDDDWCTPVCALVRHHGYVNTICKLAFPKPIPEEVKEIIAMSDNDELFKICSPE